MIAREGPPAIGRITARDPGRRPAQRRLFLGGTVRIQAGWRPPAMTRISALYRITCEPAAVARRAEAIAVEQSVEMPVSAITDARVRAEIIGRVEAIRDLGDGRFAVRIGLATETTGSEAGQLVNMLFGNSSIHPDIELLDATFPPEIATAFGGPNHGIEGLRRLAGVGRRALTCSALKPQGLPVAALADLAYRFALGGIDFIKDDHGLADQAYSPFADRVPACQAAVRKANASTGRKAVYVPSFTGDLDQLRAQARLARAAGVEAALIAPMVVGLPAFHALVRSAPELAYLAHPALAGAQRFAPPFLLGRLFRLLGADASIFTNHGGRFGYAPALCQAIAEAARSPWPGVRPTMPVPAGGMTLARVPEMLSFYGPDTMLLIGGNLLEAGDQLSEATAGFVRLVERGAE